MRWGTLARKRPYVAMRRLGTLTGMAIAASLIGVMPAFADDRPDGAELATASAMMVVIVLTFIVACVGVYWSWSNGEFEEPEEIKYEMLASVEDEVDFWGMGTHDDDASMDDAPVRPLLPQAATR